MNEEPYIPPKTAQELNSPHPEGTRHEAAKKIAISLIGNGISPQAVYAELRSKFDTTVTDRELRDLVVWAENLHPTPSGYGKRPGGNGHYNQERWTPAPARETAPVRSPTEQAEWWTSGLRMNFEQMRDWSPTPIPDENVEALCLFFSAFYKNTDNINIVCKYIENDTKTTPIGSGKTLSRDAWIEWFRSKGIPQSEAGAWIRMNPCSPVGSGKDGAICDKDITALKFILVESDSIPLPTQCALFRRWRLPIVAIIYSGSKSVHAWVRVDCKSEHEYRDITKRLFDTLKPFGFDEANKNPSRLSRLPGAYRLLTPSDDGTQSLLYINSNAEPLTQESLRQFEATLQFPAVLEKPLLPLLQDAMRRYEDMMANVGKLGVPCGIPDFDYEAGGLKKGQTYVVAGETGGCKSTLALHIIKAAIDKGLSVALFSLEMDKEEVVDLLISNTCSVNRNKFNNGKFFQEDITKMAQALPELSGKPLYIEDSAVTDVGQIRNRVMQLKQDANLALVVVDYIQFVNPGWTKETREQQVAAISHGLRALAREIHLPMVVLSQLNDEGRLRESRVISHNANVVFLIKVEGDQVKVKIIKGRSVREAEFCFDFDRNHCRLIPKPTNPEVIALQQQESQEPPDEPSLPYPD